MTIRRKLGLISCSTVLLAALPSAAAAQFDAAAELGAGALGYREVLPSSSAAVLGARVGFTSVHAALDARGRLARFGDDSASSDGFVRAVLRTAHARGMGAMMGASASSTRYRDFAHSRRMDLVAGPTFAFGPYEGAVRGHLARLSLENDDRTATGGELSLQRRYRSALVSLQAAGLEFSERALRRRDTTYFVAGYPFHGVYYAETDVRRSYVDVEAALHLPVGRTLWELTAGARGGPVSTDPGGWVQLRGTLPVSPRAAVVASFGRSPSVPEQNLPSAPFATLALRVSPFGPRRTMQIPSRVGAARFVVLGTSSPRLLRLTGVSAQRIEIMGDFTNWSPLALHSVGGDVWEATLPIAPGAHRVVIRMDGGEWQSPPDVPVAADEFRGAVGVVLVE